MNTTEQHSKSSSFGQCVVYMRKRPLSKCIKIVYIQMKWGEVDVGIVVPSEHVLLVMLSLCLNQGREFCRVDRETNKVEL